MIQPLNRSGDVEGCKRREDGSVTTPRGFKAAYKALVEGGWVGLAGDPEYGGQGLPHFLAVLFSEYECSANLAFSMYPGLTNGAVAALMTHGSDELKARYLPKMTTGEWTGTMNLTEPHCGTDLGLIKTRRSRSRTGPTPSPARRSSFPLASTISPTTSSIWRSPASRARLRG